MNIILSSNSATEFNSDSSIRNTIKCSPTQAGKKKKKKITILCGKYCRCDLALFLKVWPREQEIQVC